MKNEAAGITVLCSLPLNNTTLVGKERKLALSWCMKACTVHGFSQDGPDVAGVDIGITEAPPELHMEKWNAARTFTPRECLPYEPKFIDKKNSTFSCLKYAKRSKASGLLAKLNNRYLIFSPSPQCILGDKADKLYKPSLNNITWIPVKFLDSDIKEAEKWIGRQVFISGIPYYEVTEDAGNLVLRQPHFLHKP